MYLIHQVTITVESSSNTAAIKEVLMITSFFVFFSSHTRTRKLLCICNAFINGKCGCHTTLS